jgi:hypothetical protein
MFPAKIQFRSVQPVFVDYAKFHYLGGELREQLLL